MTMHKIDVRFTTRVTQTPRIIEVAEAFGIGLADSEFVVYDGLELEVKQGDIVYITGQSGSGKSLLLKELARQLGKDHDVANLEDVYLDPKKAIVDQVGASMAEATGLLASTGIGDAYLYIRLPGELSDGQRYRVRLAKVIETGANVWVADEFGAVLDRVTAKVVAYNIARAARKRGATLIVATTHTDLKEELGPTITVTKHYRERIKVEIER